MSFFTNLLNRIFSFLSRLTNIATTYDIALLQALYGTCRVTLAHGGDGFFFPLSNLLASLPPSGSQIHLETPLSQLKDLQGTWGTGGRYQSYVLSFCAACLKTSDIHSLAS